LVAARTFLFTPSLYDAGMSCVISLAHTHTHSHTQPTHVSLLEQSMNEPSKVHTSKY
jgi:hypothetical protein